MDWVWTLYREYIERNFVRVRKLDDAGRQAAFIEVLSQSTATLYVMEPINGTVRFKGLGRWPLSEAPDLLGDPNAFIADRFGGGKYKVNFHHRATFVGTHNFRTHGDELWRTAEEFEYE